MLLKTQKIVFCKYAIQYYQNVSHARDGLCIVFIDWCFNNFGYYTEEKFDEFPEIVKQKPKDEDCYIDATIDGIQLTYWFKLDEAGFQKRIEILQHALKLLNASS